MKSVLLCLLFLLSPLQARAGEKAQTRLDELKMNCETCHGVGGVSPVPDQTPSIAGKSERFLVGQLEAFRAGKRRHDTMGLMGDTMSDDEIRAIARHFARMKKRPAR